MARKPELPADVDRSTESKGSAAGTPGLSALDEEREASLADEGGASGALAESQDVNGRRRLASDLPGGHGGSRRLPSAWLLAGVAAGALGILALRKKG